MEKETKEEKELRERMQKYAESQDFKLNPDEKALNGILKGLLNNKRKHGEIYCPCRVVTGDKKKDAKIICPCVYHQGEIELQGNCLCTLFFSKKK